jgi:hypothetical protein
MNEVLTTDVVGDFESLNPFLTSSPVIFLNFMKGWKALEKWNAQYLKSSILSSQNVKVSIY